jgi:DegV family protein with EDD domain
VVGPTADDFRAVYKRLVRRTDQIISIHSSANLSRTYREARIASRDFLGRCDIAVMDSETLSLGLTILARIAAKLAAESVPLSVIVRQVRGAIRHIYVVLITETLDYLEHSHLISPAQAVLGSMLEIRPFLQVEEGEIIPLEKVRSPERAVDKLAEFAGEFTSIEQIAVLHSAYQQGERTELLLDKLEGIAPSANVPTLLYGPLLASYVGPDALGLMVYEGRDAGSPF